MIPLMIPKYYLDFQCIGGACEDTCCAGWGVTIDKETYKSYRNLKDKEMQQLLTKAVKRNRKDATDSNYAKFVMTEDNTCSMLLEDGLCKIHKELGESYLCNTCVVYPRIINRIGDLTEKSLTLSCPEAARLVLLNEAGIDFLETEEPKNTRGATVNYLSLEQSPYFWDLRIFIIELMQSRKHSVEIRLILLGIFLQKVEALTPQYFGEKLLNLMQEFSGRLKDSEYINSLAKIEGNVYFQLNLTRELIRLRLSAGGDLKKYFSLLKDVLVGLDLEENDVVQQPVQEKSVLKYTQAYQEVYMPFMEEKGYIFENYIVNYIFKNIFPYEYDTFFESYMMLVIHFVLIRNHLLGLAAKHQQLNDEMIVTCIQQLAKVIEHNPVYLANVRQAISESNYNTMAHMFVMIKG